jgi:hypothetical protein
MTAGSNFFKNYRGTPIIELREGGGEVGGYSKLMLFA